MLSPRPKNKLGIRQPTTSITHQLCISFLCRESNKAVLFKRIKCLIVRLLSVASPTTQRWQSLAASPPPLSCWRNCVTLGIINCEYCSPRIYRCNSWLKYHEKLELGGSFGPELKTPKSGSKNKNKQHLVHELVVINHNQQHGKENIHHSVRGGVRGSRGQSSNRKLLQPTRAGWRGNASSKANICGVCLRRKDSLSVSFMFPVRGQRGGYRHPSRPHFLNPLLAQHAGIGDRREVAKREENGAESACLSGLMMQSARNTLTPSPNLPPLLAPAMTSPPWEAAWQRAVAGLACGRWEFFPTAVTLLQAVTPATECIVSRISDFMCCKLSRKCLTWRWKKNPVIKAACKDGKIGFVFFQDFMVLCSIACLSNL